MTQVIIFKNNEGGVSVIHPSQEALAAHTIQDVAIKDVPAGKPFKIVDAADIPSDRTFRAAWVVSNAALTDGVGGESNEFQEATK
jgi:hypothetical protein